LTKQEVKNIFKNMEECVKIAKDAVEAYLKEGKVIMLPDGLPPELLQKKAGTFVTIEKEGMLRGCIGTFLPIQENIAKEIIQNAISAATEDYRFGPITKEELPLLSYTVYVLEKPQLVKDIKELDPKKYGVIIRTCPIVLPNVHDVVFDGRPVAKTGLLLPDLPEVNAVEEQISIACQKAGIDPIEEKIIIYKFSVEKYQ